MCGREEGGRRGLVVEIRDSHGSETEDRNRNEVIEFGKRC